MLWACACSISLLAIGMVAAQRGRTPQFPFMKSSASSAVVFGSTVAALSSGTGGGFTLSHSLVMSFACTGAAAKPASASMRTQPDTLARCFMTTSSSFAWAGTSGGGDAPCPHDVDALPYGQFAGAGIGTCMVISTIGAPPVGTTWCGVLFGTISV